MTTTDEPGTYDETTGGPYALPDPDEPMIDEPLPGEEDDPLAGTELADEPAQDRGPTPAEGIAASILGRLGSDDPAPTNFLRIIEAVLDELDRREARRDELDYIDIEAMVDDLEIGELKLLEKATGQKLAGILREFEKNEFGADTIAAVVWISLLRDDPEATIEDADKIKLRQIAEVDEDEAPDPS